MANVDAKHGLRLVGSIRGGMPASKLAVIRAADATATFVGDAVKIEGEADADGVVAVVQAAATNALAGVITGLIPRAAALDAVHRPASTLQYVTVCFDPDAIYEIQDDGVGGALSAADIGLNASLIVAAGNTTTGASGMELDTSTKATTATLELKILGLERKPNNEFAANAKVLVKINNHQMAAHTGTAGV